MTVATQDALGTYECMIHDASGNVDAELSYLSGTFRTAANAKIYGRPFTTSEFDAGYFSDWFGFGYSDTLR